MRTLINLIREVWRGGKEHTHCRCCGVPIKDGGVGMWPVGRGFCHSCAAAILRG